MRRVLVIGCGGAGKSTLARQLGEATGLPVIHLDAHYWRPGWVETPKETWRAAVDELIAADAWIMDGNYSGTHPSQRIVVLRSRAEVERFAGATISA